MAIRKSTHFLIRTILSSARAHTIAELKHLNPSLWFTYREFLQLLSVTPSITDCTRMPSPRVAPKPTDVNLETIIPRLKAVIIPFKIPSRRTSTYGLDLGTVTPSPADDVRQPPRTTHTLTAFSLLRDDFVYFRCCAKISRRVLPLPWQQPGIDYGPHDSPWQDSVEKDLTFMTV